MSRNAGLIVAWAVVLLGGVIQVSSLRWLDRHVPKRSGSRLDEWHHAWIGLVAVGILTAYTFPPVVIAAVFFGAVLLLYDDALLEHFRQVLAESIAPKSPAWHLWRWILSHLTNHGTK